MHKEYDPVLEKEAFHKYFGLTAMKDNCEKYPNLTRKEIFNIVRGFHRGIFPHLREKGYDDLRLLIDVNLKTANDIQKHFTEEPI